jgi:magnesium transporter
VIRAVLFEPEAGTQTLGGEELIDAWRESARTVVWVDLHDLPKDAEAQLMEEVFGLHPLAIQDAQRDRHPPKFEEFGDHTFLLLKGLDAQTQDLNFGTIQIAIFVGPRFLLTRHTGESPSIDRLWAEVSDRSRSLAGGPDALTIRLSRLVVNRYLPILLALEERLDALEDEMVARPTDALLAELVGHKANLKKLRRIIAYHVQLFQTIKTTMPAGIREELRHELTDVYEHLERTMSLAGLYYELASDLMDGYITMASHHLNQIVKILTIVTTIFVPLSFLAGVYGMNFEYIPELRFRYAYFVLLGVMATIATALVLVMRRRGWLGRG